MSFATTGYEAVTKLQRKKLSSIPTFRPTCIQVIAVGICFNFGGFIAVRAALFWWRELFCQLYIVTLKNNNTQLSPLFTSLGQLHKSCIYYGK